MQTKLISLRHKLPTVLSCVIAPILCLIISISVQAKQYYLPSMAVILVAISAFYLSFEKRKVKTSELVIICVMVSICISSRAVFAFVPQVKPLCAFVCITGICLGKNVGFTVGSISMFLSNFLFGQGAFTPFQMLAMGLVGFCVGAIHYKQHSSKNRFLTALISAVLCFFIYGFLVDFSSVLLISSELSFDFAIKTMLSGAIFNLIHAVTTFFGVYLMLQPMRKKFDRLRIKYEIFDFKEQK